jgi:predicted PurR-regulated permease PerM
MTGACCVVAFAPVTPEIAMVLRRSVEQAVGIAFLALLAAGTFVVLRPFLTALLWAVVLTYSTWPIYCRLRDALSDRQSLAALLMVLAVTCILVAPVAALGWTMADEVVRLTDTVRGWLERGLPQPPAWIAEMPLLGTRLSERWHDLAGAGPNLFP